MFSLKVKKFSPQRQNSRHSQSNCWSCSPVLCLYRPAWTTAELKPRHVRSTTRWYQYPLWCQCPPLRYIKTTLPRRCLKTGLGRSFYSFPFRDLFFVCFSFGFTSVQCSKSLKSSGYNFLVDPACYSLTALHIVHTEERRAKARFYSRSTFYDEKLNVFQGQQHVENTLNKIQENITID